MTIQYRPPTDKEAAGHIAGCLSGERREAFEYFTRKHGEAFGLQIKKILHASKKGKLVLDELDRRV